MSLTPMQFWIEGGWFMYPVLMLGGMGVFAAGASLFVREKAVARIALLLVLGSGLLGVAGMLFNRRYVEAAVVSVSPEYKDRVREAGNRESMRPVQLGGALLALGLPLALVGLALGLRRNPA